MRYAMLFSLFGFAVMSLFSATSALAVEQTSTSAKLRLKRSSQTTTTLGDERINCDFSGPTDVRDIAKAFSLWTGKTYQVDDGVIEKVRLVSPELVTKQEALKRFKRMLSLYQLKTVEEDGGGIIRIEAIQ